MALCKSTTIMPDAYPAGTLAANYVSCVSSPDGKYRDVETCQRDTLNCEILGGTFARFPLTPVWAHQPYRYSSSRKMSPSLERVASTPVF